MARFVSADSYGLILLLVVVTYLLAVSFPTDPRAFDRARDPDRYRVVERYELTGVIDPAHFFPTVADAAHAYQEQTGTTWEPPPRSG